MLLDAARPDHLGCYGYHRETTPNLDRLGNEGVIFTNAVSTASYTLTAVPSLFTGRNWLAHGVVAHGDALGDSLPTLFEVCQGAGYYTIIYSANAYVSESTRASRGCDEFLEKWKDAPEERTVDLVTDRLAAGLGAEPVLWYIHFVPPHIPYTPPDEHNLWANPAYDGPANGRGYFHRKLCAGEVRCEAEDLRNLVDLYDGNLHLADSWVGEIVASWRASSRDRELLVVVLADHGEAFGEHGKYGHNSTVYGEMIRIPLIFSPRGLCGALAPAADSLRSIADVMPMLLNLLDIPLPAGYRWPRHFLDIYHGTDRSRNQVLVRTAGEQVFGIWTPTALAVTDFFKLQELFDLAQDPGQLVNLRLERPEEFSHLSATLRNILERRTDLGEAPKADFSERDIESLKSLGYL